MTSAENYIEDKFSEADQHWHLTQLYTDLSAAKGRKLTPVEKQYLRGLLCHYSPIEMAEQLCVTNASVRTYLCRRLYRYIEELLVRQTDAPVKIKDWSWVANMLEAAGYKRQAASSRDGQAIADGMTPLTLPAPVAQTCHGVPDVSTFYGRAEELATLKQWVIQQRCRLVSVSGMAGIGKTALVATLAHRLQSQFEYVIWRSLHDQPTLAGLLIDVIQSVADQPFAAAANMADVPISRHISTLMAYLQHHRCLLILDGVQTILSNGNLAGQYSSEYEDYGTFFRRMGEESQQSCLILTTSETPKEITRLESPFHPVRSLSLKGLGPAAKSILAEKKLLDQDAWEELIYLYRGNPLALKIVASTIQDLFGSRVNEFLQQDTLLLGDFNYFLHKQFKRLSELEKNVMHELATVGATLGASVSLLQLRQKRQPHESWSEWLEALESLGRRSLIEINKTGHQTMFTLQPVILKYVLRQGSQL